VRAKLIVLHPGPTPFLVLRGTRALNRHSPVESEVRLSHFGSLRHDERCCDGCTRKYDRESQRIGFDHRAIDFVMQKRTLSWLRAFGADGPLRSVRHHRRSLRQARNDMCHAQASHRAKAHLRHVKFQVRLLDQDASCFKISDDEQLVQ